MLHMYLGLHYSYSHYSQQIPKPSLEQTTSPILTDRIICRVPTLKWCLAQKPRGRNQITELVSSVMDLSLTNIFMVCGFCCFGVLFCG